MLKRSLIGCAFTLVGVALVLPCWAASPIKISDAAPIEDLVAEAQAKVKSLEESLASNDSYLAAKSKAIPQDAGVLAILAQGVAESSEKAEWKKSAPDVRDAAISIAKAESYDAAKKGLDNVKAAIGGKSGGAAVDHAWNKLCKLGGVMAEVSKRQGKLRTAAKKADDPDRARDASVLAMLAIVAHEDTHEVKNKSEIPQWQAFSKDLQVASTALAKALKGKDSNAAQAEFKKVQTSCKECHAVFKKED